jgi:Helix-turn-helix domain
MARTTAPRNHPDGSVPPRLLEPREVATALGCSEWWVKEQARRRRIPFAKVGGAYRFTGEHLREIIRIFEQRPAQSPTPDDSAATRRRATRSQPVAPVVQLRARRPNRARKAG